ncbi:MAG: bile acid:sodium symporter family protein [Pirellulaceae bacterium]
MVDHRSGMPPVEERLTYRGWCVAESLLLVGSAFLFSSMLFGWIASSDGGLSPSAVGAGTVGILAMAAGLLMHPTTRPFSFATWVVASVALALIRPDWFLEFLGKPSKQWLTPLIQIAMLGMGATLTLADFARILKMPHGIAIGMLLQFGIMPLLGFSLAKAFQLPAEIAAGVILVGSCPGGVASNVITFLAGGDVAFSVTLTACSTLLSPLMTPWWMNTLAGKLIPVPVMAMMQQILWTVLAPVAAGLVISVLMQYAPRYKAIVDRWMTRLAMAAICIVCAIIAADSQSSLKQVGLALLVVVLLHNNLGYLLGYWGARLFGMSETQCRTIAIEVGLQNGGMAAALANHPLKSAAAAVAPALFAPIMNVSGSILAMYWRKHPIAPNAPDSTAT